MAYIIVCLHFYVLPFIYKPYIKKETGPLNLKKFSCPKYSRNDKFKFWICNTTHPQLRYREPEVKKIYV